MKNGEIMNNLKPPKYSYGRLKVYVNGGWIDPPAEEYRSIYDPGLGKIIGEVPLVTMDFVDEVVEKAYEAYKSWRSLTVPQRAEYIFKMKYVLEEEKEKLARINTQNHGKTIRESRGDLRRSIENVEAAISTIYTLAKGDYQKDIGKGIDETLIREPQGVFTVISPYNFPIMIPFWFIPYALVLGDTLIVKASSTTPLPMTMTLEVISEILPPGVLNLIYSDHKIGEHLITHPKVEGTAFVGTSSAALRLYRQSAECGKRFMGGGSASNYAVIMPDADMKRTVATLRNSKFGNAGQRCLAIQNIVIIGHTEYERFKDMFIQAAKMLKIGYGLDEATNMGPMTSKRYMDSVKSRIEEGLEEGGRLLLDGRDLKVPEYPNGFYLGPTILEEITPEMKIAREEIFGPVANLLEAESLDEAVEWINGNKYHHSAVIFTQNGGWAREFMHNVNVGNVGINIGTAAPVGWFPFGGRRLSGIGSHHPQIDAVDFFTDRKIAITRWWRRIESS